MTDRLGSRGARAKIEGMPSTIGKLGLAAASALVAVGAGWAFWPRPAARATVDLVDIGEQLEDVLGRRVASGAGPTDPHAFALEQIEEADLRVLIPQLAGDRVFDRLAGLVHAPDVERWVGFPEHPAGGWSVRTNAHGFRSEVPLRDGAGLRIVAMGDSHSAGLCAQDETFTSLLEAGLAERGLDAEVLNGAVGGYSFFHYLGALQRSLELEPDAFLLVVYGGNDFSGLMPYERYFYRRAAPVRTFGELRVLRGPAGMPGIVPQDLAQVLYFARNPEDVERAVDMAAIVTEQMASLCRERGIEFACAYLPAPSQVQPRIYGSLYAQALRLLDVSLDEVRVSDRLADGWLERLKAAGIRSVDLRDAFAAAEEPAFWYSDLHINLLGQRLVAEGLLEVVGR